MSIIRRAKAAALEAANTPVTPVDTGNKRDNPYSAYGFINGHFISSAGEFIPSNGIKVLNKDLSAPIEKFFSTLVPLSTEELQAWFKTREYSFEFTAHAGNLAESLGDNSLSEEDFIKKFSGGMLDASTVRALYARLASTSDKAVAYVDVVRFSGHVAIKGDAKKVFKAPVHSVKAKALESSSGLMKAIEAVASFKEGESYTFIPTSVAYADAEKNSPVLSEDDLGL